MTSLDQNGLTSDLTIIGTGMAGMAAAIFAANRKIKTLLIGNTGAGNFASGMFDLLGAYPLETRQMRIDPWAGIDALISENPKHPYARIKTRSLMAAIDELLAYLKHAGLDYCIDGKLNSTVITPAGTTRLSYAIPASMQNGVKALKDKKACLLVDFHGMKEYSALQIVSVLQKKWPALKAASVTFPGYENISELFTESMARALEVPETGKALAMTIKPLLGNAKSVGMPAVFGLYKTRHIFKELEKAIGVPLFEIPTMPPSVPGLRLMETVKSDLPARGITTFFQNRVTTAEQTADGNFSLAFTAATGAQKIKTKAVILATGRFLGKGLYADRHNIREALFDLPVAQPDARDQWHQKDFLDPRGHRINTAGVEIDADFRPLDSSGQVAFPNLFAVGTILAHQDWMRTKCGSGLSIASAYAAVNAFLKNSCPIIQEKTGVGNQQSTKWRIKNDPIYRGNRPGYHEQSFHHF
ncbi:MAG: glycerol-3-phosphate dehydrogenase subunit GlpB [Deltaproteobacteria bacterium]|nr:glycerol-3-phosphate dehydrogenase subunit GlpB [Deltaproteobacteria bacterium]